MGGGASGVAALAGLYEFRCWRTTVRSAIEMGVLTAASLVMDFPDCDGISSISSRRKR
jgi:hypothetical protein